MSDPNRARTFAAFASRSALVHTLTYLAFGLAARALLDYDALWKRPLMRDLYRPMDSPWVLAGPLLQPLRGLLFALVLWPLRDALLAMPRGWLVIWGLFLGLAILGTAAAAPGSIEGVIYTTLPWRIHLQGSPEIYGQTLCYAWLLFHWERAAAAEDATRTRAPRGIAVLKAVCVALVAFFGLVIAGLGTAVALGQDVDALASQPGATLVPVAATAANFALAFALGRRAEAGRGASAAIGLLLFYLANAGAALLGSLAAGAPAASPPGLASQVLPAALAWLATRALFRAPAGA